MSLGSGELSEAVPAIDCTEFVLLVDELVQTDPGHWGAVVRKHLRDCPPCLTYLRQMADLRVLLRCVFNEQKLTDGQAARVLTAITELREG